jgi:hypothetical protein
MRRLAQVVGVNPIAVIQADLDMIKKNGLS